MFARRLCRERVCRNALLVPLRSCLDVASHVRLRAGNGSLSLGCQGFGGPSGSLTARSLLWCCADLSLCVPRGPAMRARRRRLHDFSQFLFLVCCTGEKKKCALATRAPCVSVCMCAHSQRSLSLIGDLSLRFTGPKPVSREGWGGAPLTTDWLREKAKQLSVKRKKKLIPTLAKSSGRKKKSVGDFCGSITASKRADTQRG